MLGGQDVMNAFVQKICTSSIGLIILACVSCSTPPPTQHAYLPSASSTPLPYIETPIPVQIPSDVDFLTQTPTLNPTLVKVLTGTPDLQNVVSRTPSQPQLCPKVNAIVTPDIVKDYYLAPPDYSYSEAILEYLNAGGSPMVLQTYLSLESRKGVEQDLTGDQIPELLVAILGFNLFMCDGGEYTNPMSLPLMGDPSDVEIAAIEDINLNGIPEIILEDEVFSAGMRMYRIYEWDGNEFQSLIWPDTELHGWYLTSQGRGLDWYTNQAPNNLRWENDFIGISSTISIVDLDSNGMKELVIYNQVPPVRLRGYSPWRATTDIYKWNGVIFMWDKVEIEPPVYRFQAVQDGDRQSLLGDYQQAIKLYQAVISSDSLYAWSAHNYEQQLNAEGQGTPTPTSIPTIEEEYDNLVAYAHYRIMLLQILQGNLESAQATYETLQKDFQNSSSGHHFAQMAYGFWQEYQLSMDLGKACLTSINYGEDHKNEIFSFIGNSNHDYSHGTQSHYYTPWDLCPFE